MFKDFVINFLFVLGAAIAFCLLVGWCAGVIIAATTGNWLACGGLVLVLLLALAAWFTYLDSI